MLLGLMVLGWYLNPGMLEEKDIERASNLPACFRETGNYHTENSTSRTREIWTVRGNWKIFLAPGSPGKLHGEALAFEITSVWVLVNKNGP